MSELGTAIRIAASSQEKTLDKGGNPYILHSIAVMLGIHPDADHQQMAIGILHDVLEDDPEWTVERLRAEGISERVLTALGCLTHPVHESYEDYIKRVSTNLDAILVKMSDLRHNMDLRRLKGYGKKDISRMEKYAKAYTFLQEVLKLHKSVYPNQGDSQ